jgi:hypothetical protein
MLVLLLMQALCDLSLFFAAGFYLLALLELSHPLWLLLLILPPCLYGILLYKRRGQTLNYSAQKDHFIKSLRFLPLFALPALATFDLQTLEQKALPWIIIYLFCNILLLNMLRHNASTLKQGSFLRLNLIGVLVCFILCLPQTRLLILGVLAQALAALYHYVISPILVGLGYLLSLFIWLVVQIIRTLTPNQADNKTNWDWSSAPTVNETYTNGTEPMWPQWLALLKPLSIAILLVGLAIFLLSHVLKSTKETAPQQSAEEFRTAIEKPASQTGLLNKLLAPKDPRLAVRYYYRKFLLLCRQRGLTITPSSTSSQIRQASLAYFDPKKIAELHQLYIQARYSLIQPLSSDVTKIKNIYKELKKERP